VQVLSSQKVSAENAGGQGEKSKHHGEDILYRLGLESREDSVIRAKAGKNHFEQ
jgi:hypothetical protein